MYDGGSNPSGGTNYFIMKKTKCEKCGYEFANRGGCFNKHFKSCNGTYSPPKKYKCCPFCNMPFENQTGSQIANHVRWCSLNPKHQEYVEKVCSLGISNLGRVASKERKEKIKKAHEDGRYAHLDYSKINVSRPHTKETKELIRQKALASPHRRLKRKMIEYNGIWLDSTWELILAQRLDELHIKWVRPDPIEWVDSHNSTHHYFPDFYLPDYNIYLDPKNPQAVKVQKKKLDVLLQQHPNVKILYSIKECKEFTP